MSLSDKAKTASKTINDKTKLAVDSLAQDTAVAKEEAKELLEKVQADVAENSANLKENAKAKSEAAGEKIHDSVDSLADQVGEKTDKIKSKITEVVTTLKDKAEIVAKDIEGKLQEAKGAMTGNPGDKLSGEVKQAEAALDSRIEDVKDSVKKKV